MVQSLGLNSEHTANSIQLVVVIVMVLVLDTVVVTAVLVLLSVVEDVVVNVVLKHRQGQSPDTCGTLH